MLGYSENRIIKAATPEVHILSWNTDGSSSQVTVYVKCYTYNTITIDWGDGWIDIVEDGNSYLHTYQGVGEQTVHVDGDVSQVKGFDLGGNPGIYGITFYNENDYSNIRELQFDATGITELYLPDTVGILDLIMLRGSQYLVSVDLNNLHTYSPVTPLYLDLCPVLETIVGVNLQSCANFLANDNPSLISVLLPNLITTNGNYLTVYNCPALTTLNIDSLQNVGRLYAYLTAIENVNISTITNAAQLRFYRCGLTQQEVDAIITQCLDISLLDSNVFLFVGNSGSGGVLNAAPSSGGLADIQTLESRGWYVFHA